MPWIWTGIFLCATGTHGHPRTYFVLPAQRLLIVLKCRFHFNSGMATPIDQEVTVIETVYYSAFLRREGTLHLREGQDRAGGRAGSVCRGLHCGLGTEGQGGQHV